MLPYVHLQMGQLEVSLGTAGVQTHERFPLFLRFASDRKLLLLLLLLWVGHTLVAVGNERGGVGGGWSLVIGQGSHLHRGGPFKLVAVPSVRSHVQVVVVVVHLGVVIVHGVAGVLWRHGVVVLQRHRRGHDPSHTGYGCGHGSGKVGVDVLHGHGANWGVVRGREVVLGHGWARITCVASVWWW